MNVLLTCKNEKDPIQNEGARVATSESHWQLVRGPIWRKFEIIQEFVIVLVSCKNEEEPNKHEGAGVAATL